MWFRTKQLNKVPGIIERTVIPITRPMSVRKENNAEIAILIGFPPVTVSIRAKTTSTHENIKQKKEVTAIQGAIRGMSILVKNWKKEYPSINAVSSNSLGTAETKLSSTQIEIGTLNKQCANAMARGLFMRSSAENIKNTGRTMTTGGVIRSVKKPKKIFISHKWIARKSVCGKQGNGDGNENV